MATTEFAPSKTVPEALNVLITAATPEEINAAVHNLGEQYRSVVVINPVRCADGSYAAYGRVWSWETNQT